MKRPAFLCLLLFVSLSLAAQIDSFSLKKTAMDLNAALLNQDSSKLNQLLHKKCTYGHSNAWIETKKTLIANMFNGTLKYSSIQQGPMTAVIEDKTGLLRSDIDVEVIRNGQTNRFKLHVLQTWIWKNKKGWQLLGRQATRLPEQ